MRLLLVLLTSLCPTATYGSVMTQMQVKLGGKAVRTEGFVIEFVAVKEDGRCPDGANCYWPGQAVVTIRFYEQNAKVASAERTMIIPGIVKDMKNRTIDNQVKTTPKSPYTLVVRALEPYPTTQSIGNKVDYVLRLELFRD